MAVYVQHAECADDIGISTRGNIYWHDGHIDMPGQHWEWEPTADGNSEKLVRQYSRAPNLEEMNETQKHRAGRALYLCREAQRGRFYELDNNTDENLIQLK